MMPCFTVFLLLVLAVCGSFAVKAMILPECSFWKMADEINATKMAVTFSAKLASNENVSYSCVVKVSEPKHFLRVKAKRNTQPNAYIQYSTYTDDVAKYWNTKTLFHCVWARVILPRNTGFLHVFVYGLEGEEESQFLGHLDVLRSQSDWSSLTLCPPRFNNEIQDRKLTFAGSANLNFTIQMESEPGNIDLNQPKTFEINPGNPNVAFLFITPEDISKTQLDVTVTSESDVPAYLKVSQVCKEVTENIRLIDYKGESIRLSFAKKGRIALSKVSVPPLTDFATSWFIGIALKNDTGKTASDARKTVTLTLARSFDYSYGPPMSALVISTILSGVLVSAFAFVCFKDLFYVQDVTCCCQCARGNCCTCTCGVCCGGFCEHFILCLKVMYDHWFTRGPKTHSYLTSIVGFVLMVGASQFLFANWHVMIHEGDRDNCYYNDFCYRVSPWHDIPYNLMMSNLVYILHGIILAGCVCCMEANMLHQCRNRHRDDRHALELKGKISFSIGYGFAWALIFEGCFSLIYHLCPSKMTFQFDTAFMFVIAGLTVILLYNGIKKNIFSVDDAKGPVGASNAFLFFLVPLLVFNYFGALHHFELHASEKGMSNGAKITILVFLVIWWCVIAFWACYKLFPVISGEGSASVKVILFVYFVFVVFLPVVLFIIMREDLPQAFLFSCILVSFCVILGRTCYSCYKNGVNCSIDCTSFLRFLYVIAAVGLWMGAFYVFEKKGTTDKVESPEISRDKNQECVFMGFFDTHDVWHILSSHALLMGAYLIMFMSYKPPTAEGETTPLVDLQGYQEVMT